MGWLIRHRRHLAEQVLEERTTRAVTEERLRIARDMHDTVAHSLSMIAMKAGVARHVAAVRPEESLTALKVIETAGTPVSFEAVSREAGVSRSWLHAQPGIRAEIERLRSRRQPDNRRLVPDRQRASDASLLTRSPGHLRIL